MSGDVPGELRTAQEVFLRRLATMDRLTQEASHCVYRGASADRTVVADVDGNGALLGLAVDPAALRTAHPERVGPQIVAAVTAAREAAAEAKAARVRTALGRESRESWGSWGSWGSRESAGGEQWRSGT